MSNQTTTTFPNAYRRDHAGRDVRPLVDKSAYSLATEWLGSYELADEDKREDAEFSLANAIQNTIEDWLAEREREGSISERRNG